jgi:hypothetical protein
MTGPVVPLVLSAQAMMAAASGLPTINVEATCRASEQELLKLFGDTTMVTFESCMRQETDALSRIEKNWANYPDDAKTLCVQTKIYMPSYVEWHTCLEMQRILQELRAQEGAPQSTPPPPTRLTR